MSNWHDSLIDSPIQYKLFLSKKDMDKALRKLGVRKDQLAAIMAWESDAATHFFSVSGSEGAAVIIDDEFVDLIQVIGLLVHEATHIWQRICVNIGEHKPSDEFEAYCIQRISQNLIHSYMEMKGIDL